MSSSIGRTESWRRWGLIVAGVALMTLAGAERAPAALVNSISGNFLDATPNPSFSTPNFTLLGGLAIHPTPADAALAGTTTGNLSVNLVGPGWTGNQAGASGSVQLGDITLFKDAGDQATFQVQANAALVEQAISIANLGFLGFSTVQANVTLTSATGVFLTDLANFSSGGTLLLQFSGINIYPNGPNAGQASLGPFSVSGSYTLAAGTVNPDTPEPMSWVLVTSGAACLGAFVGVRRWRAKS